MLLVTLARLMESGTPAQNRGPTHLSPGNVKGARKVLANLGVFHARPFCEGLRDERKPLGPLEVFRGT